MRYHNLTVIALVLIANLIGLSAGARSSAPIDPKLESTLASVMNDAYSADAPGATAIVVLEGKVLFRGARGLANVELGVPLRQESVLRIGSITKQFTAAAIFTLVRDGKLSLSDPITRFLPDYPTQGHVVTVEHLLAHTSGIRNYTELPEWAATTRNDTAPERLIEFFKAKPFDFAPGEQWRYDNSGYILLGAIIERVSGQTYGAYLRSHIFEPLGMSNSRIDEPNELVHGRAAGYAKRETTWANADFLSMTHPYSAGALLSSVDDLARWNAAMDKNELLTALLWERATTSFALSDGTPTRYGAGWIMGRIGAMPTTEHGGGINGFNAYVLRVPSHKLYVAVLANAAPPVTPPQLVALKLATAALGISLDTPEVAVRANDLDQYVGRYVLEGGLTRSIERAGTHLYALGDDKHRLQLTPIGRDRFEAREDHSQFQFLRQRSRITALKVEPRILMGDRIPAKRIDR